MGNMNLLGEFKDIKNEAKNITYPDTDLKAGSVPESVAENHERRITTLESDSEASEGSEG